MLAMICIVGGIVSSCESGVDHSNPRSVAEKALECYQNGDYVQLKTLVNPANTNRQSDLDRLIKMADKYREEHPDDKPEPAGFTYKNMNDGLRGGEFTEATTTARVNFETEKWPRSVMVELIDGKWYFERFK